MKINQQFTRELNNTSNSQTPLSLIEVRKKINEEINVDTRKTSSCEKKLIKGYRRVDIEKDSDIEIFVELILRKDTAAILRKTRLKAGL